MAAIVVFCTTYALVLPAITMESGDLQITSGARNAVFGNVTSATVKASAGSSGSETVFYICADAENAGLTWLSFDENGCAAVTDASGQAVTLHRANTADGRAGVWFSVPKDETVSFTLSYVSLQTETTREVYAAPEEAPAEEAYTGDVLPEEAPAEEAYTGDDAASGEAADIIDEAPADADAPDRSAPEEELLSLDAQDIAASEPVVAYETVLADPDSAYAALYGGKGSDLLSAQSDALSGGSELTLRWMTAEELSALPADYTAATAEPAEEPEDTEAPEDAEQITLSVTMPDGVVITVTGPASSFPEPADGLTLTAEELDSQSSQVQVDRLFSICLWLNGEEVEPTGPVTLTFGNVISSDETAQVYHIEDEDATELPTQTDGSGSVAADTDHFSVYGIAIYSNDEGNISTLDAGSPVDTCTVTLTLSLTWNSCDPVYPVTVYLWNDYTNEVVHTITLTEAPTGSVTVEDLPRVDADGNNIPYSVTVGGISNHIGTVTSSATDSTNTWETTDTLFVPATSITAGNKYMVLTTTDVGENQSAVLRANGIIFPTEMVSAQVSLSAGPITAANGTAYSPYLKTDNAGAANLLWTAVAIDNTNFAFLSDYLTANNMTYYLSSPTALSTKTNDGKYKMKNGAISGGKGADMYIFEEVAPVYGSVRSVAIAADITYRLTSVAATTEQEYTTVRVVKEWDVPEGTVIPESVSVTLSADGSTYVPLSGNTQVSQDATVTLSALNQWTAEWTVPRYSFANDTKSEIVYSVLELETGGFVSAVAESELDGQARDVWVPADDFADDTDYIIATMPGTGTVPALTANPNGSGASWLTGYGVLYSVDVVSGSVTSGDRTYSQYIEDIPPGTTAYDSTFKYMIWRADDLGTFTANHHGTHVMYSLYNAAVGKYLKNNGNASNNLNDSVTQEGRFYYNWNSGTPGTRPPSNDSSEWGNVIGSYNDYFMLANGHIGDGGSTTAQTFFLYKKVTVVPKIKLFTLTNTLTPQTELTIHKISVANESVSLSDVSFVLYEASVSDDTWTKTSPETIISSGSTDTTGLLSLNGLEYGKYYLLYETQAHDGYNLPDTPWHVTVSADGMVTITDSGGSAVTQIESAFQINNSPGVSLPSTGGAGILPYTLAGIALMLGSGLVYIIKRRRSEGGRSVT